MLLKVDNRETTIIPALRTAVSQLQNVKLEVCQMPLGDLAICTEEGTELVVFERKSLSDLSASIKDGRYAEQSYRLHASAVPNHNIVYIIEGSLDALNSSRHRNIHPQTLLSAMVSLNYFKGFSVVRTWSILETIDVVVRYVAKISTTSDKVPFYGPRPEVGEAENKQQSEQDYANVVKKVKKDNITIGNIVNVMLCQIPNVSTVSARAISEQYNTIEKLLQACKEGRTAFDNIRTGTTKRRLTSLCIRSVMMFMLGDPDVVLDV